MADRMSETYEFAEQHLPVWRFADLEELESFVDGLGRDTVRIARGGAAFGDADGVLFRGQPPDGSTAVAAFVLEMGWPEDDDT